MCTGCMANADFLLTSGILGAASLRVGARQLLPRAPWKGKVTDDEVASFVASLTPAPRTAARTDAVSVPNAHTGAPHRSPHGCRERSERRTRATPAGRRGALTSHHRPRASW